MDQYDVAIVGGGLAGGLLALALSPLVLRIAVIEAKSTQQPLADGRSLALSYGSITILQAMGFWQSVQDLATAIHKVHVSSKGSLAMSRLQAEDIGVPALGYVLSIATLQQQMLLALASHPEIKFLSPVTVESLEQKADCVSLHFKQGGNVQAKLVLAADGTDSSIRKLLGIEADITDYQQTAIIANVKLKENHQYIAYERFSPEGPIAMLPLPEQQVAMIWTMAPELAAKRLALDNSAFLSALQQAFGYRLGRFVSIGQRFSFPLRLVTAKAQQQNRVLLFGNAAHSLHPIAGQGFNLTIRDIALLAEVLSQDPTCSPESLQRYVTVRAKEQKQMLQVTDGLVRLFAHSTGPIACLRDLGLYQFERLPWLKNHFNRMMMGKSGRLPRLARGLSLLD